MQCMDMLDWSECYVEILLKLKKKMYSHYTIMHIFVKNQNLVSAKQNSLSYLNFHRTSDHRNLKNKIKFSVP